MNNTNAEYTHADMNVALQDLGKQFTGEGGDVFDLLDDDELMALADPQVVVGDTLWLDTLCVIGGQPNTFKSFVALHMAMTIAMGRQDVWGRPVRRTGGVVYVAAEGASGVKKRVAAWKRHHAVSKVPNFHVLPHAVQFGPVTKDKAVVPNLEPAKLYRTIRGLHPDAPPVLVVIDTLARCTVGVNENSPQDMGQVVYALDQLREQFRRGYPGSTPPCLLVIHHSTKSGSSVLRGSALEGATDAVTYMEKPRPNATTAVWKTHRVKDDAFPEDMALQFQVEDLWRDEFGAQVTSGVLVPGDMASAAGDAYAAHEAMTSAVAAQPGITKTDLCKALGVAKNAAIEVVDGAAEDGVIRAKKVGRAMTYWPVVVEQAG